MTAITASNTNKGFLASQLNKVAWKRAMTVALLFGIWGSVANSEKLETAAEAFGYTVGYGAAVLVMGAGATAAMGKERDL